MHVWQENAKWNKRTDRNQTSSDVWECELGTEEYSIIYAREKVEMGDGNKEDGEDKDSINSKKRHKWEDHRRTNEIVGYMERKTAEYVDLVGYNHSFRFLMKISSQLQCERHVCL